MDLSQVRAICEAAMREYGMPARIRTDNGAPFAGTGLLGLSKLSLGWMKLGIVHERIQAGRPQQNGRHERMHRTLKEDTTKPPAASLRAQQSRFDNFRYVFNNERPHEGLNNQVPASLYIPSAIRLPRKLPEFTYPKEPLRRCVILQRPSKRLCSLDFGAVYRQEGGLLLVVLIFRGRFPA